MKSVLDEIPSALERSFKAATRLRRTVRRITNDYRDEKCITYGTFVFS